MALEPIESLGYKIYFEERLDSLHTFVREGQYSKLLLLVDRNTEEFCLPVFLELLPELSEYDIIEIDPGEENKNIDFCIGIWKMMLDFGADRKSLLINLGGGVVTDMGGFTASTFKRGFDFVQVPTTLLSQVDASVGGKTGIDMDEVKNVIGTFAQPKAVFISTLFLQTLERKQWVSGMSEMLKHGLIHDAAYYHRIKSLQPEQITVDDVHHSVRIKNEIVLQDPKEGGLRKVLNFGHTIGHAIEGYSLLHDPHPLLHGEAIAIGMICEAYLSHLHHQLPKSDLEDIVNTFRLHFDDFQLSKTNDDALLGIMANDKKNEQGQIGFSLLKGIGEGTYGQYLTHEMIRESLDFYRGLVT